MTDSLTGDTPISLLETAEDLGVQRATGAKENAAGEGSVQNSLWQFEKDGRKFVNVDVDQSLFDGLTPDEMAFVASEVIKSRFLGRVVGRNNRAFVNGNTAEHYRFLPKFRAEERIREAKYRASTELDNLIEAGTNERMSPDGVDGHIHKDVIGGYTYYDTLFKLGEEFFEGVTNIKNNKKGRLLEDITQIKNVTEDIHASYGESPASIFLSDNSMDNIPQAPAKSKTENEQNQTWDNTVETGGNAIEVDPEDGTANVQFSRWTWEQSDYVTEREEAAATIAEKLGISKKKALDYIDSVNSVAKMIADSKGRLDYDDTGRSPFVSNAEYGGSFDFTTLCRKRRLLTGF